MKSVVVLQARTNSSRLPGKVLLPIKGEPLAVLAAKRAANTGRQVIVATSTEWSDDGLAALLKGQGLGCFRGSLDDVLGRVVSALAEYDDQTIVFRLTADNIFPDGNLLDVMEADFLARGLDYLCSNGEPSGLPYGMSAEVTRLAHLREASLEASVDFDREHVTPYVIRKFGRKYFEKYKGLGKSLFRCTIDCLDDYLVVQEIFADVLDPIREPSLELIRRLEKAPFQPLTGQLASRLVFGAAQLGGPYGIANKTGQPDETACQDLIKAAIASGVTHLDTARAYGNSEAMIGQSLGNGWGGRVKVITKLSPLQDCPGDAPVSVVRAFVEASVFQSCAALGTRRVDVLMLHRASHLFDWSGAAWQNLLALRAEGHIGELGVSVQNANELFAALDIAEIRYIQLPFNLLDWRWSSVIPKIKRVKALSGLTVHVRSALLQGLLPSQDEELWHKANVDNPARIIHWLREQVKFCQRGGVADLCLSYVNAMDWVDGIATGMENASQLIDNIKLITLPALTAEQTLNIQETRPQLSEATLNPAHWRK